MKGETAMAETEGFGPVDIPSPDFFWLIQPWKEMKYFFIFGVLFMFICCLNKDDNKDNTDIKTETEIISITPMELIEKFKLNGQQTINDYKMFRIQITGAITSRSIPRGKPIIYDESGNLIDNIPKSTWIVFGDIEEYGWEIFFYFDEIVVDGLHIGDTITIQGDLVAMKRYQMLIPESVHVPMNESEKLYRDAIYIDIKDCVIIEVKSSCGR
jgi:hypothetical protein